MEKVHDTFIPGATIAIKRTESFGKYCIEFMDFDPFETSSHELSLLPSHSLICGRIPVWAALQLTQQMDAVNEAIKTFEKSQR